MKPSKTNNNIRYLSADEILQIHSVIIDETGGSHGVRELSQIKSVAKSPAQAFGGNELYPEIFSKAAVYLHNIINHHSFVDGNKRTAMTAAGVFLELNDRTLSVAEGEVEKFALRVVEEKLAIPEIAEWLKKNSKSL